MKDFTKASIETTFEGGERDDLGNHRSHNFNLMIKSWSKSSEEKETGNGQYNFNVGKLSLTYAFYDRLPPWMRQKEGMTCILTLVNFM